MRSLTRGLLGVATFVLLAVAGSPALAHGLPGEPPLATSPKPASPRKAIDLTISTSGDILIHQALWEHALDYGGGTTYNFRPFFRRIRPYIAGADLAFCHVETPLLRGTPVGFPVFRTPPELARAIKATGWDVCSTASNHTLDHGQDGIDSTIAALRRSGVRTTGSARSVGESRRIPILKAKGVKVAFLAYTQLLNGQTAPHPWSINMAEPDKIIADAKRARRRGAKVVIVNLHWGVEFASDPTAEQMTLATRLARSPAITVVVGEHAHVVQPIRRVGGKLVVFGQGNLIANQGSYADLAPASRDGIISLLRIRISKSGKDQLRRVDYVPVFVSEDDFTVLPVGRLLRQQGDAAAPLLESSWQRTLGTIGRARAYGPWRRPTP
jgi:poly-gamma-glutamate synthesis protein (capsule biosynthesis protein)